MFESTSKSGISIAWDHARHSDLARIHSRERIDAQHDVRGPADVVAGACRARMDRRAGRVDVRSASSRAVEEWGHMSEHSLLNSVVMSDLRAERMASVEHGATS